MAEKPWSFEDHETEVARTSSRPRLTGPEKTIAAEACVDCGAFGPWSDGEFFYCTDHVPAELRNRGATWNLKKA